MAWRGSEAAGVVDAFKAASVPSLESRGEDGTRVAYLRSWTTQVRRAGKITGWEKGVGGGLPRWVGAWQRGVGLKVEPRRRSLRCRDTC
ncbi:hypothetical protein E2562_018250 [Oryza meyeriana var. granulata]|uniref:Uncharacterized protein n=1 Tax=Oryza meyeriana var. granulata TaxID=110450 RepID=A0A6G1CH56_9ORYZ|nr:hypothetical protein E2562_018250 [Oryza meyeriana var. granulata]